MPTKSRLLAVLVAVAAALPCTAQAATADSTPQPPPVVQPAPAPPTTICLGPRVVSIADYRGVEGTRPAGSSPTPFVFTLTSTGCANPATVYFTTLTYRATAPDYRSVNGTLSFPSGDMSARTITVLVAPDTLAERDEDFQVRLCLRSGFASLPRAYANGYILNDDGVPGAVIDPQAPNFHCSE